MSRHVDIFQEIGGVGDAHISPREMDDQGILRMMNHNCLEAVDDIRTVCYAMAVTRRFWEWKINENHAASMNFCMLFCARMKFLHCYVKTRVPKRLG